MSKFLYSYKTTENNCTHTRIGDKELNIYGGKYLVKDNDKFLQEYFTEIVKNGNKEYLTEKQLDNGVITIDFDFRYCHEVSTRQHDKDMITNFIIDVTNPLTKFFNFTNQNKFDVFVMEKPNVNRLKDGTLTKDGINIIIGINMEKNIKKNYRNIILNQFQNNKQYYDKLPLINGWESVIDKGVLESTTNWQLYGSRKPDNEAYELTYHYIMGFDENDQEFIMDEQEIKPIDFELFKKLSVRNNDRPNIETKVFYNIETKERSKSPNSITHNHESPLANDEIKEGLDEIKEGLDEIQKCLECVKNYCKKGEQPNWSKIGQILKNELKNEGEKYFVKWTTDYGTTNKKIECKEHYNKYLKYTAKTDKNRISKKTLHYYAKKENPYLYNIYFPPLIIDDTFKNMEYVLESGTECDIAKFWVDKFGKNNKCIDPKLNKFYQFNDDNLWKRKETATHIRLSITEDLTKDFKKYYDYLSNEVKKYEDEDSEEKVLLQKKCKLIGEIMLKFKKTTDKDHITCEIKDYIYDVDFEKDMNKELDVLPLKNKKMFDMKTLKITDRTIKNKFNYECDVDYVEMNVEQEADIKAYFMSLFCNKEDTMLVVLNILNSIFVGLPLKYIFFFTGEGNNGKSILFDILKSIFVGAMDTISKDVILDTKQNNSITTQFEKLDKVRVGYATEMKEEDILNVTNIKAITGGDAIDVRKLFKTNETLIATCNLCVLTNKLPKFDVEPAILQRLIIIPMDNTFEIDNTFKTKILDKKNLIFSYIMKFGIIQDKFNLTDEMIQSKNDYKDNNTNDYLNDFIKEKCELVKFIKKEKIEGKNFILEYKNWLLMNKFKDKNMDKKQTYYTQQLKKLLKIEAKESNGKTYYKGIIWKEIIDSDSDEE